MLIDEQTSGERKTADDTQVLNIAHRGASGRAPENTLAAYELALDNGADYIEQDVRLTRDGVLVVVHDKILDRTARGPKKNCTGPIVEKTLAQIKTCEVGSWFNEEHPEYAREEYKRLEVPTLEEVFRRYHDRGNFYLDLKEPSVAGEKLLELMGEYDLRKPTKHPRVVVVSSEQNILSKLHALAPSLPLTQAYPDSGSSESTKESLEAARKYAIGINPRKADSNAALIKAAHKRRLGVYPYVVNDRIRMKELMEAGVDGMFTAFPSRLEKMSASIVASNSRHD